MACHFHAETADELWKLAARALLSEDRTRVSDSRLGETYELLHCMLSVGNPKARWVISRTPPINPAFAIVESLWILSGRQDSHLVNHWNPALPKYAGSGSVYHGAYGHRLRNHFRLDQLESAYRTLQGNPATRQVVLQIWDPRIDLPHDGGQPVAPDVPCNISSCVKIRDGRLEWLQVMRSNDVFRGTPYNLVQFTVLQEVMAGWLGLEVGDFVLVADSLHLYKSDAESMKLVDEPLPDGFGSSLALPKDLFDMALSEIVHTLEALTSPDLTAQKLMALSEAVDAPDGYRNLLSICVADAARRRGWPDEQHRAVESCTDPTLRLAFNRWAKRMVSLGQRRDG